MGHFPLGLETSRGIGRQVLSIDLYDLGTDYLKSYCEQIRKRHPEDRGRRGPRTISTPTPWSPW